MALNSLLLSKAKFKIGQYVRVSWFCDEDNQIKWEDGYIVGLWFDPPELLKWDGWGYAIQPVSSHTGQMNHIPESYLVAEDELIFLSA